MTTPLDSALAYAARGWPVVPLHSPIQTGEKPVCSCEKCHHCPHIGKHPRYRPDTLANGAHSATTNASVIRGWWGRWSDANVGVAVGPRAGLLVLDIDPRNGGDDTFAGLVADLGPLPETVEAKTGGGGRHLLFVHPGGDTVGTLGPGVDVIGSDGKLIVVEPSVHPSGRRYCWELSSAPESIPLAELPESWKEKIQRAHAMREDGGYRENREDRESGQRGTHPTPVDPAIPVTPAPPPAADPQWTEDRLFSETLPTGRGQHDRCSMNFARGAKMNLGYATPEAAQAMFDRWWARARPLCAEQDDDSAWFKFVRGFDGARIPLGANGLASMALEAAKRGPLPLAANKMRTERMRLLVGMCCHLKRMTGGSFRLSCWQLGELFGVKPAQAWEWLRNLERALVIRCVDRGQGGAASRRAATFEYVADDLPGARKMLDNAPSKVYSRGEAQ